MLMITACIAAALLLVALPTGLSVKTRLPGAQSLKETSDASVVAQFKTFGLPAKSFLNLERRHKFVWRTPPSVSLDPQSLVVSALLGTACVCPHFLQCAVIPLFMAQCFRTSGRTFQKCR